MNYAKQIARGALIAALYTVLTILLAPILYGPVQCRVSEAFTLLPFYFPEAVPGLFIGCVISNFIGGE
ncbi:MAG: QueT transporter family protein [Synergistaceae bacterium]|nr:QueT transporter family protein [Synergistaceae bacterium]